MALSGGLAGLAGAVEVIGLRYRLYENFSPGYGYDAIAVALLANSHPLGVVLAAGFFGALQAGANRMQQTVNIETSLVFIIQALTVIFVIAAPKVGRFTFPRRGAGTPIEERGGGGACRLMPFLVRLDRGEHSPGDAAGVVGDGDVFAERSGVFNIGMEGMMLTGAFVAVTGSYYTDNVLLAAVTAMLAGGVLSLVHAYVTITRRANQIISGAAINLFALGLTNFLYRALLGSAGRKRVEGFPQWKIPVLGDIPVVGPLLFDQSVIAYVAYVAPLVFAWVLFRTTWGLNVRAVGEYPLAADTAACLSPGSATCRSS